MDVVLVGLPGSGKTAVGRRLARRHDATLVDLDERIEAEAGMRVPEIFATEGEAGFRARERAAIERLGPADRGPGIGRVVATGGGAVVDPRNRWRLYRGRVPVWLDVRPEIVTQRLRNSPNVRPLVADSVDPLAIVRALAEAREPYYAAAHRIAGVSGPAAVAEVVERVVEAADPDRLAVRLLDARTRIGRFVVGDGIAVPTLTAVLDELGARRAVVVSEPVALAHGGAAIVAALAEAGREVVEIRLPGGEAAKRLGVVETAARELARARVERGEPIVAIGGGALGDSAGFLAAVWLRGVPVIHVPTTLVAQIDSSIGGKTAVDLPEGKNLVGAFHQPAAVVVDIAFLRSLPARHRRAALGEAVKMGLLGDERLLALLEAHGTAIAEGSAEAFDHGWIAELVERCLVAKVAVVTADERETGADGGRIALNLGHSVAHGLEAADGYRDLLHGEAVAHGLRFAGRLGHAIGVTPAERLERAEALLDRLDLGRGPLPYPIEAVLGAMGQDKKHAGGRLRWVLPTADGIVVRSDVDPETVRPILAAVLAGEPAAGRSR
jgi:shikimate kinase/3-dehydroquinate synthase